MSPYDGREKIYEEEILARLNQILGSYVLLQNLVRIEPHQYRFHICIINHKTAYRDHARKHAARSPDLMQTCTASHTAHKVKESTINYINLQTMRYMKDMYMYYVDLYMTQIHYQRSFEEPKLDFSGNLC
jgi:hypothetical protein